MGNGGGKLTVCFTGAAMESKRERESHVISVTPPAAIDGVGHSFCYLQSEIGVHVSSSSKVHSEESPAAFRLSGASVGANAPAPLSTSDPFSSVSDRSSPFESSSCFTAVPLHPIGKSSGSRSAPMDRCFKSGPIDRVFKSGPMDRGFKSGPIDRGFMSGPIDKVRYQLQRSFSHGFHKEKPGKSARSVIQAIHGAISRKKKGHTLVATLKQSVQEPMNMVQRPCENLQWAQGRAGEDRFHVVVSEEHKWIFMGIYDGFNGPDAPDYLSSNLYDMVHEELKSLLSDEKLTEKDVTKDSSAESVSIRDPICKYSKRGWRKHPWKREGKQLGESECDDSHKAVLKALSRALRKAEDAYLCAADKAMIENPELALMGSCVLAMLVKGDDVYVMNVGDSRAILAQKSELGNGKLRRDLQIINEEPLQAFDESCSIPELKAIQLTIDHCTSIKEEVRRIRREHPDDLSAVVNGRVKGYLKVTRAFGVGFLKQPKWNDALLEMFRIKYIGSSPYITCAPSLSHHRIGAEDMFVILSSDGLCQYITNEDAVREVQLFLAANPQGDPAQHLVEQVLLRAAIKAGIHFYDLLQIPLGDRRRYHDDISIIVISLQGRIWKSFS